ncbi:MAG: Hsp20/alpha crystallin family protein [Archaeoglobaceae archaeon]
MSNTGPFEDFMDKVIKKVARTLARAEREFYKGLEEDATRVEKTMEKTFDGLEELWEKNKGELESDDNLKVKTSSKASSKTQNVGLGKEVLVDIFEDKEEIIIVAGLPGVEKEDISVYLEDSRLKIEAGRYFKDIKLPRKVKEDPVETDYRNGVLTLRFEILE